MLGAAAVAMLAVATMANTAQAKYAAIVLDADDGTVLHSVNADTRNFPASLTKMMTLYLTFEALDSGRLKLDQKLKVSRTAAGRSPSKLGLRSGQTITVEEIVLALVVKSANDAATVISEELGGTEREFAKIMTRRARELGMSRTTFRNASGLPNRGQLSTARDIAILSRVMIDDFGHYYHLFGTQKYRYAGRTYRSHNRMLTRYHGVDGIKTGYIRASGFNIAASVERDGHRLIGVVFGGRTAKSRDRQMAKLFDKAFRAIAARTTVAARPLPKPTVPPRPGTILATASIDQDALIVTASGPSEPSGPSGQWGIQVGAFGNFEPAQAAAGRAANRLPNIPPEATIEIRPVETSGRVLYRARLMGMQEDAARRLCREVRGRGGECGVVTPSGNVQLAAAR